MARAQRIERVLQTTGGNRGQRVYKRSSIMRAVCFRTISPDHFPRLLLQHRVDVLRLTDNAT
jgi:hypothetical protein